MRKKIFKSMCFLAGGICILAYIVIFLLFNYEYGKQAETNVQDETYYLAETLNLIAEDEIYEYLEEVDDVNNSRITWIDADGTVLYDTEGDSSEMENHLDRPEVQQALEEGASSEVRHSSTLKQRTYYFAVLLENGTVLRLSLSMRSVYSLFLYLIPTLIVILLIFIAVMVVCAKKMTDDIVHPINELNLFDPNVECPYEELQPLMARIRKQNEERRENEQVRQEFSANVSHELKTPLTTISGYAELMKDGMVKEKDVPVFSEKIYKEAARLIDLVNDTIMISRLDEHKVEVEKESVDLYNVSIDIKDRLETVASKNHVTVSVEGQHVVVQGVYQMLDEMIYNLCDNAIKYNKPNGKVFVRVNPVSEGAQGAQVVVEDTGIGIPKEHQGRVFERFYRVDKSHSRQTGGTGLGLAIVKHVVEYHDGKIKLESEVNVGTRITVIL